MKYGSILKSMGCAALVAAACAGSPAWAQQKQKVTLMLNWYATGLHSPLLLGKQKGYFEKAGIDLEIQEGRGSGPTVQAVASKNVMVGFADITTMMKLTAKGAPVKAVGVVLQRSPFAVISLAEKKILRPADIKGKTLALTAGDSPSQAWPLFLKKNGLKEADYKTLTGDSQTKVNAVINGQADMLLGFATDQGNQIETVTGKPVSIMLFADQGVDNAGSSFIVHNELIKERPDLLRAFLKAAALSMEETEKNPEAAVDALLKAYPKAGTREALMSGLKTAIPLFRAADGGASRLLHASPKTMATTVDTMVQIGAIDKGDADPARFYTADFLP